MITLDNIRTFLLNIFGFKKSTNVMKNQCKYKVEFIFLNLYLQKYNNNKLSIYFY